MPPITCSARATTSHSHAVRTRVKCTSLSCPEPRGSPYSGSVAYFSAGQVAETSAGAPKIVRCKLLDAGASRRRAHDIPEHLGRHAVSPHPPGLVDGAEDRAVGDGSRRRPRVHGALHPSWNRDGSDMSALANQIGDDPMLLPPLDRLEGQCQQLGAAKSAANQHGDHRVVPQLAGWRRVSRNREAPALLRGQPVPEANADPPHPFSRDGYQTPIRDSGGQRRQPRTRRAEPPRVEG